MKLEQEEVTLRKLIAGEGKVIISKELDEKGRPITISKEIYLGNVDSEDNYEEVDESYIERFKESEME